MNDLEIRKLRFSDFFAILGYDVNISAVDFVEITENRLVASGPSRRVG